MICIVGFDSVGFPSQFLVAAADCWTPLARCCVLENLAV